MKRYSCDTSPGGDWYSACGTMVEDPQGEYVLYEDVPGWVSVDEREPTEEGRYVVIYSYKDKFSRMFIGDYYIAPDGKGHWSATGDGTVITHWLDNMIPIFVPVPNPPGERR